MSNIRRFVWAEAAAFIVAALAHAGVLARGYEHSAARNAETVIAAVLLAGIALGLARPAWQRATAIASQGFALLGVAVGLFTIAVGVGPRTVPDIVYHVAIVVLLVWGLTRAIRVQKGSGPVKQ